MGSLRRTCMRRLGRRPPAPPPARLPPRRSPAPTPPAAEDAARCCSPADCSHRAMTASPESPAAADEAAAAAEAPPPPPPPRWDRFWGAKLASGAGIARRGGGGIWRPDLAEAAGAQCRSGRRLVGAGIEGDRGPGRIELWAGERTRGIRDWVRGSGGGGVPRWF